MKEKEKATETSHADLAADHSIAESAESPGRLAENKYQLFFEHSSDGLLVVGSGGQILDANAAACTVFQMTAAQMRGADWSSLIDEADRGSAAFIVAAREAGKANASCIFIRKDGSRFQADVIAAAHMDEHGQSQTSIIIHKPTAQTEAIKSFPHSEPQFKELFFMSPQPMWVFETESFRFVQVNKAAIELYGYSQEEFMTMSVMDIKPREDVAQAKVNIKRRTAGYGVTLDTFRHIKKSGETIEVEVYSNPIVTGGKVYLLVMANDVTGKNQQEHRIVKAIIQAQEEERYEISKELHEDVCQILAASQLSLGRLKEIQAPTGSLLIAESKEYIANATRAIRKLSQRLAPGFHDFTTLKQEFVTLLKFFDPEDKYKIGLYVDNAVLKYNISLDLKLNLYRILQEVLKQTLQYANCTTIDVKVLIQHGKIRMIITDDGDGFEPAKVKDRIGMSSIKRRASLFAGKLMVDSSPGNGCTVSVDIPLPQSAL